MYMPYAALAEHGTLYAVCRPAKNEVPRHIFEISRFQVRKALPNFEHNLLMGT
jgi:hypothetical protein